MNIPVPQINALFAPRQPVEFIPPIDTQRKKKKSKKDMDGVGDFVQYLETGSEYDEIMKKWKEIEQRPERRERIKVERKTMCDETLAEKAAAWDPSSYVFETDAYKTLFIGRLNFMTDEHKIKREMEQVSFCIYACRVCLPAAGLTGILPVLPALWPVCGFAAGLRGR